MCQSLLALAAVMVVTSGQGTASASSKAADAPASAFIIHHQLEAEVGRVDRDTGVLFLKTSAGRLKLDVGAKSASLRKGDLVLLQTTLIRHSDPAGIPRDKHGPAPQIVRRLQAEVAGFQRSLGAVILKTTAGVLTLDVPEPAISALRTGDQLMLELAVMPEPEGYALSRDDSNRGKRGIAGWLFLLFGRRSPP